MDDEVQRRLDEALDRLVQGGGPSPAGDPQDAELLDLARAVRAFGEPPWPEDAGAFVEGLMPPARTRRRRVFAWPGAAAAVAAALLAAQPALPAAMTALWAAGAPSAAPAAQSAPMEMYAQSMPTPAKIKAAPGFGPAVHGTARSVQEQLEGVWLQADILALRRPAGVLAPSVAARDLMGRTARLAVRRLGPLALVDFRGLPPGWYRLQARGASLAILLPLPPGWAVTARLGLRPEDQATRLQGVRLVSLDASAAGTSAEFWVARASLAAAIGLASGRGDEWPLSARAIPARGGFLATLVFDPLPRGQASLRFVARGPHGVMTELKSVALRP